MPQTNVIFKLYSMNIYRIMSLFLRHFICARQQTKAQFTGLGLYTIVSSLQQMSTNWNVDSDITRNLGNMGVSDYFPVQKMVIPLIMRLNSKDCLITRDICVSAPTGSGKTLAYAVPIVSLLCRRQTIRLRALVILPSRELASQVFSVICHLITGTDLRVINCIGQTDFHEEQQLLVGPLAENIANCDSLESLFSNRRLYSRETSAAYGSSNVDILVCTPGRLIEHLQRTRGFSLKSLRFLVLDEADKLLGNAYHYWVKKLIDSTREIDDHDHEHGSDLSQSSLGKRTYNGQANGAGQIAMDSGCKRTFHRPPLQRLLFSATLTDNPAKLALLGIRNPVILKTEAMHRNASIGGPEGDQAVGAEATSVSVSRVKEFVLPSTLREYVRVCDTTVRPLHLIGILLEAVSSTLSGFTPDLETSATGSSEKDNQQPFYRNTCSGEQDMCIVFSSSVDMTHRLARLLQLFNGQHAEYLSSSGGTQSNEPPFRGRVAEISRLTSAEERAAVFQDCLRGKIKVLVSSDNMARGIDLPNVKLVINYDQPKFSKTYVHRVGRTARAGKDGYCITLLKNGQSGVFRKMRSEIEGGYWASVSSGATDLALMTAVTAKCKISKSTLENATEIYNIALKNLQPLLDDENKQHES